MAEFGRATTGLKGLISRRHFVIGGALFLTSAIAFARQPTAEIPVVKDASFEDWVPQKFAAWSVVATSGVVLPPADELSDRLYDNLVTRVYRSLDGTEVMLLLAYNNKQDGVLQVHRPEVCYPVGGFVLTETEKVPIPAMGRTIPGNFFTATGSDRREQVVYFTRLGDAYPRSWAEQRVAVMEQNLAGRIPDGIMLRASILSQDRTQSLKVLLGFINDFTSAAPASLRDLLVV